MTPANIMIDTESFGVTPGSAILSIGAVKFDPEAGRLGETFQCHINLASSLLAGLTADADTIAWWRQQSDEARAQLLQPVSLTLQDALFDFGRFLVTDQAGDPSGDPVVWCRGGSFDFPLLAAAYKAVGQPLPWKFWNERDCRTLLKVAGYTHGFTEKKHAGVAHSALDDARHQAEETLACLQFLRNRSAA